jgi:hypothetical protein
MNSNKNWRDKDPDKENFRKWKKIQIIGTWNLLFQQREDKRLLSKKNKMDGLQLILPILNHFGFVIVIITVF